MLLRFRCKDCGQKYQVPDTYATGEFKCVECGGEMEIPENSTLHDRPPVDFGSKDVRPLVDIPVIMKAPKDNHIAKNSLTPEKEAIDTEPEVEPEPRIGANDEIVQPPITTIKPPVSTKPPSIKSATPAVLKTMNAKLPLLDGSSLQMASPSNRQITPPLPRTKVVAPVEQSTGPAASIVLPGTQSCKNHPHLQTTSSCNSCHSPICLECRKTWGYYCSAACRDASLSTIDRKIKMDQVKENAKLDWVIRGIKIFLMVIVSVLLVYIGLWIWHQFLDPAGKVAWQWQHPVASVDYLSIKPHHLVLLADDAIITLDPQTGKIISSFNNELLQDCPTLQRKLNDKILISGEKTIALLDMNAKALWKSSFKHEIIDIVAGTEAALVTTQYWIKSTKTRHTRYGRVMLPDTAVTHRYALDFKQGKKLWQLKLNPKSYRNIVAVEQRNYVSVVTDFSNNNSSTILQVNSLDSNKKLWGIKLPGPITLGPLIYQGNIIFRINDSLNAVSLAGKKIWNTKVTGYNLNRNFKADDGLLFLSSEMILTVFDLKAGKILWSKPSTSRNVSYEAGKLFMHLSEADKEYTKTNMKVKLPPAYEKLKQEEPVIKSMFENKNKRVKYDNFIICLDARSGKQLWKSDKVRGQLIVGFERAVIFRDTAKTSIFSAISNSNGKSVIGQLDLTTGQWLFERNDDIGIAGGLTVVGDKLIGLVYDRNAGRPTKNMKYSGLAAFNLK